MNNKDRVSDCLHSKNTLNSIKETTSLIADRVRGMIAGNILGDMVGLPLEGMKPTLKSTPIILEKIEAARLIQEHLAKYNCNIYSDDTSMFIALFYSLLEKGKVDKENELNHYRKWLLSGKYTPDGKPFGYGKTTYKAVTTGAPGSTREENGNGALMRSSIITAFYLDKSDKTLEEASAESASVTHAHPISIFSNIIHNILLKYTILGKPLHRTIDELYDKFRDVMPDINDIFFDPIIYRPSGYVVSTLQTAVWLNLESMSFEEILAKTLIIGGDTDTIAAIACAIAGTIYGYNSIPDYLKNMVINVLINYPELYNYFNHYNF